jgi:hypothetical protein
MLSIHQHDNLLAISGPRYIPACQDFGAKELMDRKNRMTMEEAVAVLRQSGWKVEVDPVTKTIVLEEPYPDVNWLHPLRHKDKTDCHSARS